jgi:hypothetical protein
MSLGRYQTTYTHSYSLANISYIMTKPASDIKVVQYDHDMEARYLPAMRSLITDGLSEPYSIYVYRYFLCQWAHLCYMVSSLALRPG